MNGRRNLKQKVQAYLPRLPAHLFKLVVAFIFVFPFYWMFVTSFKPYIETIQFQIGRAHV